MVIGAALTAALAVSLQAQEPKKKDPENRTITVKGCLDGNWLNVVGMDMVGSYRERYRLHSSKAILKEMASAHKGSVLEVTGVVTDREVIDPAQKTTHRGKTIEIGQKTKITTGAKETPTVPRAGSDPSIEIASYRDTKERCK